MAALQPHKPAAMLVAEKIVVKEVNKKVVVDLRQAIHIPFEMERSYKPAKLPVLNQYVDGF